MKLPNDLIKATDYSKAKDREIHEFEYTNGKYIHKYVLGGEHELTPQEVVDCLNAISTIDCDLQTAYAFIQGQKDKISDLEAKLAESEKKAYSRGHSQRDIDNEIKLNALREDVANKEKRIVELKQQLAEKEKEITKLKSDNHSLMSDYAYQEADMFELTQKLAIQNQDKISFAVEQLTLFKNTIVNKMNNPYSLNIKHILSDFDNQIKALKEGK